MKKYTKADIGCYGDGTFGHEHIRDILADLLQEIGTEDSNSLIAALQHEMSDDLCEDDALDLINERLCDGCFFCFENGDLLLVAETDEF